MANQLLTALSFGYGSPGGSTATLPLSTTATFMGLGFMPQASKQVTSIRAYVSAVTGTITAANMTAEIQTSTATGIPSGTDVTGGLAQAVGSAPAGAGWVNFTGFTANVTVGNLYWVVFKTADGTNFPTYQYISGALPIAYSSYSNLAGWLFGQTTNSGTNWTGRTGGVTVLRVGYSDGTYDGFPISAFANDTTQVFSTTQAGVKLTLPGSSAVLYNIAGISMPIVKSGSPTGQPNYNLYVGNSTVSPTATTVNYAGAMTTGTSNLWLPLLFSSTQQVPGGSIIRIALADSTTDSSSNCFKIASAATLDTDANSAGLAPLAGGWQKTVLSGGSWTDTPGTIPQAYLLLDSTGEITALQQFLSCPQQPSIYWDT